MKKFINKSINFLARIIFISIFIIGAIISLMVLIAIVITFILLMDQLINYIMVNPIVKI